MKTSHDFHSTVLREYDIRGIIGETLSEADAYAIGRSFGTIAKSEGKTRVAVGRDGRVSSPSLAKSLISGLVDSGLNVDDIGEGPTPMLYFAVHELAADGGIQITGSHNPPNYNGFKMMMGLRSFFGDNIQRLGSIAKNGEWSTGSGTVTEHDITDRYVARMLQDYEPHRPIDVVWDAGNGVAGPIMEKLGRGMSGRHAFLFADVDGTFPNHHPDPTEPENLVDLINTVKEGGYEIGIGFDGDADRIGVVDSEGRIVWGDQLLQILAIDIVKRYPGATIIADVKASDTLFKAINDIGGNGFMYKTGHSLIKEKMIEMDSPLSGEMSGHIFYKDKFYGHDDALYVAVRLIEYLGRSGRSLKEFVDQMPVAFNTPEIRIDCDESEKFRIVGDIKDRLIAEGRQFSDVDGVRVSSDNGWWLLRASNTQAVIVARIETQKADDIAILQDEVNGYLSAVSENLRIDAKY